MSQVYATEPQTSGRVLLETTHGPLDIHLWCRECPHATRIFMQYCLDGFYDNMIFHRIVPQFLIQTGALRMQGTELKTDPSNAAYRKHIQAEEALQRRRYELNSRIRFNHRGQVAMALTIDDEDDVAVLQPQFFITLDEASNLDNQHILFGTVSGPTIFNAIRIGNTDVDGETSQPAIMEEAPRIIKAQIMENPRHTSLVQTMPESLLYWKAGSTDKVKKKKKRKGVKNVNILSFGDEMVEQELLPTPGIKSSHDVAGDRKLSKSADETVQKAVAEKGGDESDRQQSGKSRTLSDDIENGGHVQEPKPAPRYDPPRPEKTEKPTLEKQTKVGQKDIESKPKEPEKPKISLVEARRAKYGKKSKDKRQREEETLSKLMSFQKKVRSEISRPDSNSGNGEDATDKSLAARMAQRAQKAMNKGPEKPQHMGGESYHGQILESQEDEKDGSWIKTKFSCRKHMDHDSRLGGDGRNAMDDYEVVDEKRRRRKHRHKHKHAR